MYFKILYFIITFSFFLSCNKIENTESEFNLKENTKENEIWNPVIMLTREGLKLVKAKSDILYKDYNEMAVLIGNVKVDFFNEQGSHVSALYSDSARIDEETNNLYANGNVYVISDSGYTLNTYSLVWDHRYEMIVAEDSVMFTHPAGDTLYGIGFESDSNLEKFKIYKPFGILREGV